VNFHAVSRGGPPTGGNVDILGQWRGAVDHHVARLMLRRSRTGASTAVSLSSAAPLARWVGLGLHRGPWRVTPHPRFSSGP
jgi:hypothetical protein